MELQRAGADVYGYALEPPPGPNLFTVARVAEGLAGQTIADVRDGTALKAALCAASPEIVFHLAAQPLVRQSYIRSGRDLLRERVRVTFTCWKRYAPARACAQSST